MKLELGLEDFRRARSTIEGLVHRTPILSSRSLGERCGERVWLKAENLQKTGSFKPRGAFNRIRSLDAAERARGVVTASAGNHGQAVAYVAAHERIPGYVVMPEGANPSKVAAVKAYGAHAILHGKVWDDAYAHSLELAAEKGLVHVHPFKDRHIMEGQGSVAFEILEDVPGVRTAVIPVGGGGLISGMAMAFRALRTGVRIVGVEPAGSANMFESRRLGVPKALETVSTIADGLATKQTDPEVFEIVERLVDDLVTVTDAEILVAIRFLLERAKLLTEPAGAATVAAILAGKITFPTPGPVVVVLSGGNFDVARMRLGYGES